MRGLSLSERRNVRENLGGRGLRDRRGWRGEMRFSFHEDIEDEDR